MTPALGTLEAAAPGLVSDDGRATHQPGAKPRRRALIGVAVALLVLVLAGVALTTGRSAGGELDPRSAAPRGSLALATLLRERGVDVRQGAVVAAGTTVLVPFPEALTGSGLADLLGSGADVVLVDPGPIDVAQLGFAGHLPVSTRNPGCALPVAATAGLARLGGTTYTSGNAAVSCYGGALLQLPPGSVPGGGTITVLGSSDFMTNDRLDQAGNAALALGLLSAHPDLTWYTARKATGGATLTSLLPKAVPWALLQLAIALGFVALWRGRRLGPVVTEPLPVIVRAAETVLGRARLYAAARARATAAEAMRTGSRARLAALVRLEPGARPEALISAVAGRTRFDAPTVAALLFEGGGYGSTGDARPGGADSDAALVRLATDLDQLEREVARA